MKQKPSFQCYQQDILSSVDVQMMSAEEFGCYMLLLLNLYNNTGVLNADKNALKILCRGTEISEKVFAKFYVKDGLLRNKRVDAELRKRKEYSKTQSENVKKRWNERNTKKIPTDIPNGYDGIDSVLPNGYSSSSSSSSNLNTTNVVFSAQNEQVTDPAFSSAPDPEEAGKTRTSKRGSRIPADFWPDETRIAFFTEHLPTDNLELKVREFVNYWSNATKSAEKRDWQRTFENRVLQILEYRNEKKQNGQPNSNSNSNTNTTEPESAEDFARRIGARNHLLVPNLQ